MTELRDHFVYRAFDVDGRALYVGCTSQPGVRYISHLRGDDDRKGWFGPFAHRWVVTGPLPKSKARPIEKQAIKDLAPVFNSTVPRPLRQQRVKAYYASRGVTYPVRVFDQRLLGLRLAASA